MAEERAKRIKERREWRIKEWRARLARRIKEWRAGVLSTFGDAKGERGARVGALDMPGSLQGGADRKQRKLNLHSIASNRSLFSEIMKRVSRVDAAAMSATDHTLYDAIHGVGDSRVDPQTLNEGQRPMVQTLPPRSEQYQFRRIPMSISSAVAFQDARAMAKIILHDDSMKINGSALGDVIGLGTREFLRDTLSFLLRRYETNSVEYLQIISRLFLQPFLLESPEGNAPIPTKYEIAVAEAVNLHMLPTYGAVWSYVTLFFTLDKLNGMRSAVELENRGRVVEFWDITHFYIALMYYRTAGKVSSTTIAKHLQNAWRKHLHGVDRNELDPMPSDLQWNCLFVETMEFLEKSQNAHSIVHAAATIMMAASNFLGMPLQHEYMSDFHI